MMLCAAGCQAPESPSAVQQTAEEYYRQLPAPAKMDDKALAEQAKTDKAVIQIATDHLQAVEREQKDRWIARIRFWCNFICIIALLAGIAAPIIMVAAFKLPVRIAAYVGAGLLALSGLAFVFSWTLEHLGAIGIAAGILAALVAAYEVLAHWRALKAAAVAAREDVAEEFAALDPAAPPAPKGP